MSATSWFFEWPTIASFILFVFIITAASMLGLYLSNLGHFDDRGCDSNNIVGIFIAVISIFLGVILSSMVVEVWDNYINASSYADLEASNLVMLYQTLNILPGTERARGLIATYIDYVIRIEYPALGEVIIPYQGDLLFMDIQNAVYRYVPETEQQSVLYGEAIRLVNEADQNRVDRLKAAISGLSDLIWWITVINSILLIVMSWFLICCGLLHYVLTAVAAIYIGCPLFLSLVLAYPFRGFIGLQPLPFEEALIAIGTFRPIV